MITVRRNMDRRHVQRGKHDIWLTFYPQDHTGPVTDGFGALIAFNEMRLPPGEVSTSHPREAAEVVTYVYRGALAQEDSIGSSGVVYAGEFQRMTVGRGIRYQEANALKTDDARIIRISLLPSEAGLEPAYEQMRFSVAQRHNLLCVIASPDGRERSLRILQNALIYSSILDPGHHLVHELLPGRSAWLHVICGEAALQGIILTEGDGVGVTIEPSVSLTAQEKSEILLIDLGPKPRSLADGSG